MDETNSLSSAENDADANFGFGDVETLVVPCSPGASSSGSSSATVSPDKKHWVEIALVDQEGNPVPGHAYQITVPGGIVVQGSLDSKGRGRVDGIDAGSCKITFPGLDKEVWTKR